MSEKITQRWDVDARVLELLACPACTGELRVECETGPEPERLVCRQCGRAFPIVDGIPLLIAER